VERGTAFEVMERIAVPMMGGMIFLTPPTLIVNSGDLQAREGLVVPRKTEYSRHNSRG
jgi:hypothetical protein